MLFSDSVCGSLLLLQHVFIYGKSICPFLPAAPSHSARLIYFTDSLLLARTAPDIIISAASPAAGKFVRVIARGGEDCFMRRVCGMAMHRSAVDFLALCHFSPVLFSHLRVS